MSLTPPDPIAEVRAKLSAHQANLAQVSTGQRVFVTLDEARAVVYSSVEVGETREVYN